MGWSAVFAPAGTPKAIVNRLNQELNRIVALPDIHQRLLISSSAEVIGGTPEELDAFVKTDTAKWAAVVKAGNIRAE